MLAKLNNCYWILRVSLVLFVVVLHAWLDHLYYTSLLVLARDRSVCVDSSKEDQRVSHQEIEEPPPLIYKYMHAHI